jgi:hypothetical protein
MATKIDRHTKEKMPVAVLQHKKKRNEYGWLRNLEREIDTESAPPRFQSVQLTPGLHLSDKEREKVFKLFLLLLPHPQTTNLVAFAWGVERKVVKRMEIKAATRKLDVSRQKRKDAGKTIIVNHEKRCSVYTPKFVFAKYLRNQNPGTVYRQEDIDAAWEAADESTRDICAQMRDEWLEQGPFLVEEITRALKASEGCVSWRQMANLLAGSGLQLVGAAAIREYVMTLPDSAYKTTRLLPQLNQGNKQRRKEWAHQFWIFWHSAVTFNGVQILLVHMDEKWFWAIVVRMNQKCVPFLGIEPVNHEVHHKSSIDKIMGIASTAFAPYGNDITKGGTTYRVNLVRAGGMVAASRDSYKRVYRDDGTFHYPKEPENLLRRKGELYFKGMTVTGSDKGTEKEPKFDLLSYFRDTEIPRLDEISHELETSTGKRVIVRYQMDNATPHVCATLKNFILAEFDERNWQLKYQPSNSPVTNVKDDYVFPALSKQVSQEQVLSNNNRVYNPDDLWTAVEKRWNGFRLDVLARAYVRHSQIASAIAECQGGDEFVRERGGLHCNVRKCCVTVCDNNGNSVGVEVVSAIDPDETESNESRQLRYNPPDLNPTLESNLSAMEVSELECMFYNLPPTHEWHDMVAKALLERGGFFGDE